MSGRQYGTPMDYRNGEPDERMPQVSPINSDENSYPYQSHGQPPPPPPPHQQSSTYPSDYHEAPSPITPNTHSAASADSRWQEGAGSQPYRPYGDSGFTQYGGSDPFGTPASSSTQLEHQYTPSARSTAPSYTTHDRYIQGPIPAGSLGRPAYSNSPSRPPINRPLSHRISEYDYGNGQGMRQPYRGDGYEEYVDPRDIADDGDDGIDYRSRQKPGGGGAVTAGAGAGVMGALGRRDGSGNYGPVPGGAYNGRTKEENAYIQRQSKKKRRRRLIIIIVVAFVIIAAIVGGVAGGILASNGSGGDVSRSNVNAGSNYDINSPQVQAVLNNKNLHKVFPGMDYTPLNAQYPACLQNPPSQDNITLDVAVLSQLTPAIRLYGTDCEQTEKVLTAIDRLGFNDTLKVWLGVYLDDNASTNKRQLSQMYEILSKYPSSHFAGVIVGNEVLYNEWMTATQLGAQLTSVRKQLSAQGITLPVATADLGDKWTAALAADTDIVMSNVHPFFAGVKPGVATSWTWDFWQTHDVVLTGTATTGGAYPNNIISETGWPSQGGNDCGDGEKCPTTTAGAIASIEGMNTFMDGWVCQSLANGTTYFWFEAFDEPWKAQFNTPSTGDFWEPHWGLMDVNRNLKEGVRIPDCGGRTIDRPY